MKNVILSALLSLALIFGLTWMNQAPKAWADVNSLPRGGVTIGSIAPGDKIQVYAVAGNSYGMNWTDVQANMGRGINWTDFKTYATSFAVNGDHSGINWGSFGV